MNKLCFAILPLLLVLLPWGGCPNNPPADDTRTPDETENTGDSDRAPTQMDEDLRQAAMDAVGDAFDSLRKERPADWQQPLVDFLNTQPEYMAVGIFGTEVYAQFHDGLLLIFVNNRDRAPSDSDTAKISTAAQANNTPPATLHDGFSFTDDRQTVFQDLGKTRSTHKETSFKGIPASPTCYVAHAKGSCFDHTVVRGISVELQRLGYEELSTDWLATVDDLKTKIKDVGVFYIDTHGGGGVWNGSPWYGVWTATDANTPGARTRYWGDTIDGSLTVMYADQDVAPGGGCTEARHFAFTGQFVRKYMTFSADSFVYVDACNSQYYEANELLMPAFFDKKVGASAYAGWQESCREPETLRAAAFLFDRLLGGNERLWQTWPIFALGSRQLGLPPEDPPQRPFDYPSLLADMRARNPRLDMGTNSRRHQFFLDIHANPAEDGGDFGLLAPSISNVTIDERSEQIQLLGAFGSNEGRVVVSESNSPDDGTDLEVISWSPGQIDCRLPVSGPGSKGNLWALVDNRRSNVRQITDWHLRLNFRRVIPPESGGCTGEFVETSDVDLHLRASVSPVRYSPGPNGFRIISGGGQLNAAHDSTAMQEGSGTISCTESALVKELSGSGQLPLVDKAPLPPNSFILFGSLRAEQSSTTMLINLIAVGTTGLTITTTYESGPTTTDAAGVNFSSSAFGPTPGAQMEVALDENFGIIGGSSTSAGDANLSIRWEASPASFPPDRNAPQ